MVEVVCVGATNWDTIAVVDRLPRDDERMQAETVLQAGGGPAATAAVALARLGVPVGFAGVVGADDAGRLAVESLEREGVDVSRVQVRRDVATGQSLVLVCRQTSGRAIVTTSPPPPDGPVDVAGVRWAHADHSGWAAVRDLVGGPVRTSLDGGNPVPGLRLSGLDLYAPTQERLEQVCGVTGPEALVAARAAGAREVVATRGAAGALVLAAGAAVTEVPGFAVEVTSTLGAGDVFHGALLAGLVTGHDLAAATRRAAACAALSCRGVDGRSAIPDAAELDAFLAAHPASPASPATPSCPADPTRG